MGKEVVISALDPKTRNEKSKEKIKKYKEWHTKATEKLVDMRTDCRKKNAAGRHSPNEMGKITN